MTINLDLNVINGGSQVLWYELEIDDGTSTGVYVNVTSYDTISPSHILDEITDSLTPGTIYNLRFRAANQIGYGPYSNTLRAALIDKPATPTAPIRIDLSSTKTSIAVTWSTVSDSLTPGGVILGYKLYMATGLSGSFNLVYDGLGFPTINTRIVADL